MTDKLNPYFVTGIIMATTVEDARDIVGTVLPFVERSPEDTAAWDPDEDHEEPILLSVIPMAEETDEAALFLVEADDPGNGNYLALLHVKGEDEKHAEGEIVSGLGNWNGFRSILGMAEFDPDDLNVELDLALDELSDDARESFDVEEEPEDA